MRAAWQSAITIWGFGMLQKKLNDPLSYIWANTNILDIARHYHNTGSSYMEMEQLSFALEYYFASLTMMAAIYGADSKHPQLAATHVNIANVYRKLGDYTLAREHCTKAIDIKDPKIVKKVERLMMLTVGRHIQNMLPYLFDQRWKKL